MKFLRDNLYSLWLLSSLVWAAFFLNKYDLTTTTNILFLFLPPIALLSVALGLRLIWDRWLRVRIEPVRHALWDWLGVLFFAGILAALGYFVFAPSKPIPGWDELGDCSELTSLDNSKELTLSSDHEAELNDESKSGGETITGTWSFDETTKRYLITLNGSTTTYVVVSIQNSPIHCMLIKGELHTADLSESWFPRSSD